MNSSLRRLRNKYILTASTIVFAVILLMIFILNLLMRITYRSEENMLESIIGQAAVTHVNQPNTEYFSLSEAAKTDNGDYIIPRNVRDIANITVYGHIESKNPAIWYSAGGGLMFEADTGGASPEMVYKDYTFNRDTSNVSIDFTDYNNIKCGINTLSIDESQIVSDYFLVSVVWWKNSSNVPFGTDEDISLDIDSIEIHYKESRTISSSSQPLVSHITFSDIFDKNIPEALNTTGAVYLITDSQNQLISVNDGNLMSPVSNGDARDYAARALGSDRETGKIKKDGTVYSYTVRETDGLKVIIFVNDSFTDTANGNLLRISLLVGGMIWLILTVLIVIVSGFVIKPVAENMERQKQFISNASHELKTPITVISATIDIISAKKGSDRWTDCIKEQVKKMQTLVTELLDLSKLLEARSERSGFKLCDISGTITQSLLYFESLFFESGKTLRQDIEENIIFSCDENKISRLVGILMDNALKYSDAASTIDFSLHRERDGIIIRCSNLCSDFEGNDTSRLFDRFYRSDNDRIHEQEGFGLGLSIGQAIAELHGGTIKAEVHDKVITFTVTLPQGRAVKMSEDSTAK